MRNLSIIFRRELQAYYTSVIGYVFIIVFLILSVGLYITPFFTILNIDMRAFFSTLPIIMCIFLPAITMRVWAEERKQNTWEMLLTFPMQPYELVLGKFFASLFFFLSALAGTFTIPLMLASLGNPDLGPILGAYLGTVLLGAFFLALGLFISVLCRDQIVAFVLSLLACFGSLLLDNPFITAYIEAAWPGLGSFLHDVAGMAGPYATLARGIVALNDVMFFLIWSVVFLFLNGLFLEIRSRLVARNTFYAAIGLCLAIAMLSNWTLTDLRLARFDLTENKIYTLSAASVNILQELEVPAYVNLYITPHDKMPIEMRYLERDIVDKLDEMRLASGGKLQPRAIHMETANLIQPLAKNLDNKEDSKEEAVEKRLLDKGIRPFSVQALREDEVINKLVYAAISVAYKDRAEELIPRVIPADLQTLEYRLMNILFKLKQEKQPVVALFAPHQSVNIPPYMRQLYQQIGRPLPYSEDPFTPLERMLQHEKYDVRRIELTRQSPIPSDASTLLVINPRSLSERQKWEISRFLHEGKSVLLAVQTYRWDYNVVRQSVSIVKHEEMPQINPLIRFYGVAIDPSILMDVNHQSLTIRPANTSLVSVLGSGITLNLPLHIVLPQETMNRNVSITSRLSPLFYLWGSALKLHASILHKHHLTYTTLLSSSPQAWTIPSATRLSTDTLRKPAQGGQSFPLAVLIQGQFPDVYASRERPAWSSEPASPSMPEPEPASRADEPPPKALVASPGKLLLIGNAQMFHRNFLIGGNADFIMNSVDALALGDEIINIRSKKSIVRTINKPDPATRQFWKFINLAFVNILIVGVGISTAIIRRRSRAAYNANQHN